MQARFQRADGQSKHAGRLLQRQLFQVTLLHGAPRLRRQLLHTPLEQTLSFRALTDFLGRRRGINHELPLRPFLRIFLKLVPGNNPITTQFPNLNQSRIDNDGRHLGKEIGPPFEAPKMCKGSQHRVLHGILRVFSPMQDAPGMREQPGAA
jgi:hypothetical protein